MDRDPKDHPGTARGTDRVHCRTTGELLLYLFGSQGAAQVELSGDPAAIEAVRRAHFGM